MSKEAPQILVDEGIRVIYEHCEPIGSDTRSLTTAKALKMTCESKEWDWLSLLAKIGRSEDSALGCNGEKLYEDFFGLCGGF